MKISFRPLMAALVLGAAALSQLPSAQAGCDMPPPTLKPNAWIPSTPAPAALRFADYRPGYDDGSFLLTSDDGGWHYDAPIVGMWRFKEVTPGPNGTPVVVDDGYAQWHSDGTEIQNSGLHAPITSAFCLGVWKRFGSKYKLNHFPLAWDSNGLNPANAIWLTETVWLTDQNHMAGTFTIKVYPWTTTDSLNVSGPAVATIKGTLTATRVTVDSTVPGGP